MLPILALLFACVTDAPETPKTKAEGTRKAAKARPRRKPFKPIEPILSTFETIPVAAKVKRKMKGRAPDAVCRWFRINAKQVRQPLMTWDRPCPDEVQVVWAEDGRALVSMANDVFRLMGKARRRLPGNKAVAGTRWAHGFDEDGEVVLVTRQEGLEPECADTCTVSWKEGETFEVQKGVDAPILVHTYHLNEDTRPPSWTHQHVQLLEDAEVSKWEEGLVGPRTEDLHPGVHGLEGADPDEETAKILTDHAPEGDGGFQVAETEAGLVAWWTTDDAPAMPVLREMDEGFAPLLDVYDVGEDGLTLEYREKHLLLTTGGERPRLFSLESGEAVFSSNDSRSVSLWPDGVADPLEEWGRGKKASRGAKAKRKKKSIRKAKAPKGKAPRLRDLEPKGDVDLKRKAHGK